MTSGTLFAAALAAVLSPATIAVAKAPAPLIPIALVEDVKSATADVEFMDYVGKGQVIKLAPRDVLVLSYLKSCAHETITGGTVMIGAESSEVEGGKVTRAKVPCNGGKITLTSQQANASAASSFRLQSANIQPVLYALPPIVQVPKGRGGEERSLVIERADRPGQRIEVRLGGEFAAGGFYDLGKANAGPLARGGVYSATIDGRKMLFKVHAKAKQAKAGKVPIISRLLRFTPG
jgi:hypothetical protein